MATQKSLKVADYVVTEAGFGADLGAEKFFDIKCRKSGLSPKVVVVVATIRALKMHGGVAKGDLKTENISAIEKGFVNLERHLENLAKFGVPALVAINHFYMDTDAEIAKLQELCQQKSVSAYVCKHWADGGAGAEELAQNVVATVEKGEANFKPLYADDLPVEEKIRCIAQEIYRADDIQLEGVVKKKIERINKAGWEKFPICMAKTQYSFTTDPKAYGAPTGHTLKIQDIKPSAQELVFRPPNLWGYYETCPDYQKYLMQIQLILTIRVKLLDCSKKCK